MNISTEFEVNLKSSLSGNVRQVLRQSEEDENSTKYDQILIRSESPSDNSNKFVQNSWKVYGQSKSRIGWKFNEVLPKFNQVCGTPIEYFDQVCPEMRRKCVVYHRPWKKNKIQWSVTENAWGLWIPLIRISTKFEVNSMISMSRNVQKLNP